MDSSFEDTSTKIRFLDWTYVWFQDGKLTLILGLSYFLYKQNEWNYRVIIHHVFLSRDELILRPNRASVVYNLSSLTQLQPHVWKPNYGSSSPRTNEIESRTRSYINSVKDERKLEWSQCGNENCRSTYVKYVNYILWSVWLAKLTTFLRNCPNMPPNADRKHLTMPRAAWTTSRDLSRRCLHAKSTIASKVLLLTRAENENSHPSSSFHFRSPKSHNKHETSSALAWVGLAASQQQWR